MSYILTALFIAVILFIFIFDFFISYTGPGTYVLKKITSGKFPPPEPTLIQGIITALVGVGVIIGGILVFAGVGYLILGIF